MMWHNMWNMGIKTQVGGELLVEEEEIKVDEAIAVEIGMCYCLEVAKMIGSSLEEFHHWSGEVAGRCCF